MNRITNNIPLLDEKILLAVFAVAISLPGLVQAQTGIDPGLTTTGTSSGQQAVANLLNAQPCVAGSAAQNIAKATAGIAAGTVDLRACGGSYGGSAVQQLSNQADIQVNTTVLASPAETTRVVRCLSAKRNGVQEPGCEDVVAGAARTSAAPGRAIAGPFGFSVVVRGDKGKQDTVSGQTGFDASAGMLTAGLDYRFSDKWVGGLSFNYQHTNLDFDFNSGTLKNDAYRLAPFFSYAVTPDVLIDGLIGVGFLDYNSNRTCTNCVQPGTNTLQTLVNTASFRGTQWFGSIGIGKSWPLGAWALRGYARGDYVQVNTDGYTEAGTFIANTTTATALQVQSQRANSLTSLLGIHASRAISTSKGVITPSARVEWVHEFEDNSRTINSQFVSVPGAMTVTTVEPVPNWVNLGIGVQMNFAHSLAGFLDYVYTYKTNASNNALSVGIRWEL